MSIISKDSVVLKQFNNFKSLNKQYLLGESVRSNKNEVLDQQRTQLLQGLGNDNKKIKPNYRNKKYAAKKAGLNPMAGKGTPDLKLSGNLHEDLNLVVGIPNDDSYYVFSDVEYFSDLDNKYKTAFGLSDKSAQKVTKVNNDYLKSVHKEINK